MEHDNSSRFDVPSPHSISGPLITRNIMDENPKLVRARVFRITRPSLLVGRHYQRKRTFPPRARARAFVRFKSIKINLQKKNQFNLHNGKRLCSRVTYRSFLPSITIAIKNIGEGERERVNARATGKHIAGAYKRDALLSIIISHVITAVEIRSCVYIYMYTCYGSHNYRSAR